MSDNVHILLENATATGNLLRWKGGRGVFKVDGTLGGATVTLQYKGTAGNWRAAGADTTITDLAVSAGGVFDLDECDIRALVAGGTPSGLYATAGRLPT